MLLLFMYRRYSKVGSPSYMSVEVLTGDGKSIDIDIDSFTFFHECKFLKF
jgi:hypothetical protein